MGGAHRINHGYSQTVVNWAGGMHHAKKSKASQELYHFLSIVT